MATEDKILYRCTLCQPGEEYTNDNAGDVKKHITTSDNGRHEGKQSDMQFIEEVDKLDKESVEANERMRHEGEERTIVENNTGSYEGPATGLDMTGQHITERDKKKAEEIVDEMETDNEQISVDMTPTMAFKIIRTADESIARELFDKIVGDKQ